MPHPLQRARFLKSVADVEQLGNCFAEVAFVGRSNVGKSSLLNALCHHRQLAKVSKTPGRTRIINVFVVGADRWLVDLPGYGFARGPEKERLAWRTMIENYLLGRPTLKVLYLLVDAEVGPTPLDHQMVAWLQAEGIPFRIVATKVDKVKSSHQVLQRKKVAEALNLPSEALGWVSAAKGTGIAELRQEVAKRLGL